MTALTVEPKEAQLQLERILASAAFRKAQRSQRFLRFLVEASVTQPGIGVKEYAVALEVFDRSADYDPTVDATVRVEASRLRQRLREYYEEDGRNDSVVITVPKGGYQAVIRRRPAAPADQSVVVGPDVSEGVRGENLPDRETIAAAQRVRVSRWLWPGLAASTLLLLAVVALLVIRARRVAPGPGIHSVAVMPFTNLSSEPNSEYFADGITEGLSAELAGVPDLQVVADSTEEPVSDSPESLLETARKLRVDAVVEGSVLRANDKASIDVHLFDARSHRQLWASRYVDKLANITVLQMHMAAEIAAHAGLAMTPAQRSRLAEAKLPNPLAYDGYLQGRYQLSKRNAEGAVPMFRRAVALDPEYAQSWAGLAAGLAELAMWRDRSEGLIPEAKAAARHAIDLDPRNGEAWSVLGQIAFNFERDWKGADLDLEKAAALSPSDSTTESRFAIFLSMVGRHEEALQHMRRALDLDPLSFFNVRLMGSVLYWSRHYDESLIYLQKAEELEPGLLSVIADWVVADYTMKGMPEQAIQADLRNFAVPDQNNTEVPHQKRWHDRLRAAYRSGGRKAYWEERIKSVQDIPEVCRDEDLARIYVLAGQNDNSIKSLERGLRQGCFGSSMMKTEPVFDPLRTDPRFQQMLRQLNLAD